nr:MAG TPA: hypothetical protein [Caudoviricetes sp.]
MFHSNLPINAGYVNHDFIFCFYFSYIDFIKII